MSVRSNPSRSLLRTAVCAAAGLSLVGGAFQATFASAEGRRVTTLGAVPEYPPNPPADDDDGDGLSSGELAGIAAGGAAGVAYAAGAFGLGAAAAGAGGAFAIGEAATARERLAVLPENQNRVAVLQFRTPRTSLRAGMCRALSLEAQSAADGQWYSVTQRPEASFELKTASSCLVKQDGSRNIFCVPLAAPQNCDGEAVTVVGRFRNPDGTVVTAEAVITVKVPAAKSP